MKTPSQKAGRACDPANHGLEDRQTVRASQTNDKPDVTDRSYRMPKNSTLLYPRSSLAKWPNADPPDFSGFLVMEDGKRFWVNGYTRTVKGREVFEIRLNPAQEGEKK